MTLSIAGASTLVLHLTRICSKLRLILNSTPTRMELHPLCKFRCVSTRAREDRIYPKSVQSAKGGLVLHNEEMVVPVGLYRRNRR